MSVSFRAVGLVLTLPILTLAISPAVTHAVLPVSEDPASASIRSLDNGLTAIMKGGKAMGFAGRAAQIGPVVDQVFDIPAMTRLSVGPAWTSMTEGDKTALIMAFRRSTIAQYAGNFDGWSGEVFTIDPKVETRGSDRLVKTVLKAPKGNPTQLAYRLRQSGGSWRVIDIFYQNSISQLATRRSDFARIVSIGGAKALIAHLDQLSAKAAR
ncbi:hopanoid biosynthesis protein HpnM [Sphingomonas paeninsulae]|uniref:Hopanoid biosynthesis protein HpnM n=1 Tax=Sphingomonas paeninsulae TaxID=2319844 RepID=A0A494THQ1_SPHPE|nr:ABC transporter substrate-binding protein [Sphingomonas paeninsulae]AYJ86842.1 hopanoid biosynthesis protein HpnM [Sphingomonas paeninsulae]